MSGLFLFAPWRRLTSASNVGSTAYQDALPDAAGEVIAPRILAAAVGLSLAVAAAVIAPAALLLDPAVYYREDAQLGSKMDLLRSGADSFDVGVLGTSRVVNGFDPDLAEKGAMKNGCALRFANLGLTAMSWGDAWAAALVAETAAAKPRLLLQEMTLLVTSPQTSAARSIWGERLATLSVNIGSAVAFGNLNRTFRIAAVSLLNELPTSGLARLLAQRLAKSAKEGRPLGSRGYVPITLQAGENNPRRVKFLAGLSREDLTAYVDRRLADERARNRRKHERRTRFAEDFVRQIEEKTRTPVLAFAPPTLNPAAFAYALPDVSVRRRAILEFTPARLPELYRSSDYWFDQNHVNESGTELFSEALGRDVCEFIKRSSR